MANKQLTQETFPVTGMSCAACAARVDKTLNRQEGVAHAAVNYAAATATIEYDRSLCSPQSLRQAVQDAGYDLIITHTGHESEEVEETHRRTYRALRFRTTWAIVLSLPVLVTGMFFMHQPWANPLMFLLSTPVVFWLGRGFFINAWKQLKHKNPLFKDYVWHWFLLTGYDTAGDSCMVKAVTYGEWQWLDMDELWDTGFEKKGGLILYHMDERQA